MNKFAFLFPDQKHFDTMVNWGAYGFGAFCLEEKWKPLFDSATEEEKERIKKEYRKEQTSMYSSHFFGLLNRSIRERYRENNFEVNWIVLNNEPISPHIETLPGDKIILSGVNFRWGPKKEKQLTCYPHFSRLVRGVGDCEHLRIGGHMLWSCVNKFAKAAHERGLNVMVDEDLTDHFQSRVKESSFKTSVYPSINFREFYFRRGVAERFEGEFMRPRKGKPWFYQNY